MSKLKRVDYEEPWLIINDFNSILYGHERSVERRASSGFMEWVKDDDLINAGFTSPKFTWSHENSV